MQLIKDLNFGFHDGSAFLARKNKELLKDYSLKLKMLLGFVKNTFTI